MSSAVLRAPEGAPAVVPPGPPVLEVALVWGDTVLALHHFGEDRGPVTAGSATGHRWRLLGRPVAWVPPAFARLAWLFGPAISEARAECRADLFLPGALLPSAHHRLFWAAEGAWWCAPDPRWTGRRTGPAGDQPLAALPPGPVALEDGTALELELGGLRLRARPVRGVRALPRRVEDAVDVPFLAGVGAMTAVALALAAVVAARPPVQATIHETDARLAALQLSQPVVLPPPVAAPPSDPAPAGGGAAAAPARAPRATGAPSRRRGPLRATEVGLLGALDDDAALAGLLGGDALAAVVGGVGGGIAAKGVPVGAGGWGARGGGLDGGGEAVGLGPGRGRGPGGRPDGIEGGSGLGPKARGQLRPAGRDAVLLGALDRAQVDAVIKRHASQIRHCYQRALNQDPDLGGKLSVRFVIGGDGQVEAARVAGSSVGSDAVGQCIVDRFHRFRFPAPKGGGKVIVTYPFFLQAG